MKRAHWYLATAAFLLMLSLATLTHAGGKPGGPPADPVLVYRVVGTTDKIYVANADGTNATAVYTPSKGTSMGLPAWTSDGRSIAFGLASGTAALDISVVNGIPAGTNLRTVIDAATWQGCVGCVGSATWSPPSVPVEVAMSTETSILVLAVSLQGPAACADPSCWQTIHTVPENETLIGGPTWSPEGQRLAVAVADAQGNLFVRVVSRADGSILGTVGPLPVSHVVGLEWARQHDKVAFDTDGTIFVLDLGSGVLDTYAVAGGSPSWSPDDTKLVFSGVGAGLHDLRVLDLSTLTVTKITKTGQNADWKR